MEPGEGRLYYSGLYSLQKRDESTCAASAAETKGALKWLQVPKVSLRYFTYLSAGHRAQHAELKDAGTAVQHQKIRWAVPVLSRYLLLSSYKQPGCCNHSSFSEHLSTVWVQCLGTNL